MNRGRRRGGGPSLSGLRDGVKRRLFDPHSVPTKPDAKFEVNRLIPLCFPKPFIQSCLSEISKTDQNELKTNDSTSAYTNLLHFTAVIETAFCLGPFYHSVPVHSDGIDLNRLMSGRSSLASEKLPTSTTLLHLLLGQNELNQWSTEKYTFDSQEPDDWFPKDLVSRVRMKPKVVKNRKPKKQRKRVVHDISEVITDKIIQQVTETLPENDDDITERADILGEDENGETDSEDARWNGEIDQNINDSDLDEEEFDNDYCQTYFDNGERDFSDDGLGDGGGDDDDGGGGSRYYD